MKNTEHKTYVVVNDAGHAWLSVRVSDCRAVGLLPKDITACSFMNDGRIYLEEDVDAATFIDAFKRTYGHDIHYRMGKTSMQYSYVRSYPNFHWGSKESW